MTIDNLFLLFCKVIKSKAKSGTAFTILAAGQKKKPYLLSWLLAVFIVQKKYMVSSDFLVHQREITSPMRCVLIDWLIQVQQRFKLLQETLYVTVSIIDRYLSVRSSGMFVCCQLLYVCRHNNTPGRLLLVIYYLFFRFVFLTDVTLDQFYVFLYFVCESVIQTSLFGFLILLHLWI